MEDESENLEEGFMLHDDFDIGDDGEVVPGIDLEDDKLEDPEDHFS